MVIKTGYYGHEKVEYNEINIDGSHEYIDGEWIYISNNVDNN